MKFKDKNDSIRKVSLIDDLSMGISYNTAAQVRPWSDLSFNLRLKLSKELYVEYELYLCHLCLRV